MKAICRNCHFLAKEYRETNTGRALSFSLREAERGLAESDPDNVVGDHYSLKCALGVWDEGLSPPPGGREYVLNLIPRKDACFFFPHHPAMLFEAARELQKRAAEYRELKRSNLYTRIGLYITGAGLIAAVLIALFKG